MVAKGVVAMLDDIGKIFAAETGHVLTGFSVNQTVTGWRMVVKRFSKETGKQVLFLEGWSVSELFEELYKVIYDKHLDEKWKEDKF